MLIANTISKHTDQVQTWLLSAQGTNGHIRRSGIVLMGEDRMARYIDADRLNAVVNETLETLVMLPVFSLQEVHLKTAFETLTDMINNAPTVDAVPVVRCGECKYYEAENHNCLDEMAYSRTWCENDYCSFGERKDDETD